MYSLDYVTIEVQRLERAIKNEQEHCKLIASNIVSRKNEISLMQDKIQQSKTREEEVSNKIKRLRDSISANRSSVMMVEELRCDFVKQCHVESIKISDDKKRLDTIISKYENKWEEYHKIYKTFPLFKELQNSKKTVKLAEIDLLHCSQQILEIKQKLKQITNIKNEQVGTEVLKFVMLFKELNKKNAERNKLQKEMEHLKLVNSNLLHKKTLLEENKKKRAMQQNMIRITEAGSDNKTSRRRKLQSCEQNFEFCSIFDLPSLESPPPKIFNHTKDTNLNSLPGITDFLSFNWLSFVRNKNLSETNLQSVTTNSTSQIPEQSIILNCNVNHCNEEELMSITSESGIEQGTVTESTNKTLNFEGKPTVNETLTEKKVSDISMETSVEEVSYNREYNSVQNVVEDVSHTHESEVPLVNECNVKNICSVIDKISETETVSMETTDNVNSNQISDDSREDDCIVEQFSRAESLLPSTSTSVTSKNNSHRDSGYTSFIEEQSEIMSHETEANNTNNDVSEIVQDSISVNSIEHAQEKLVHNNKKINENDNLCPKNSTLGNDNVNNEGDKTVENPSTSQGSSTPTSQASIVNESNNDTEQNTFLSPQEVFGNILPFRQNYSNFEMSPGNASNDSSMIDQFMMSPETDTDFWTNPIEEEVTPGFSFSSFNPESSRQTSAFNFSFGGDGQQNSQQEHSGGFSFGF